MAKKQSAAERFLADQNMSDNRPLFSNENNGVKQYKRKPSNTQSVEHKEPVPVPIKKKKHSVASNVKVKRTLYHSYLRSSYISAHTLNSLNTKNTFNNFKRTYTPVEAEKINHLAAGEAPISRAQLRPRRKAKRSLIFKPAPLSITAPQSGLERKRNWIFSILSKQLASLDYFLIVIIVLISSVGMIAVHTATLTFSSNRFDFMQVGMTVFGIFMMLVISFLDYDNILKYSKLILIFNVLLLLVTFIFGSSVTGETNANWLKIGPLKIQPSEFAKVFFILSFGTHLEKVKNKINSLQSVSGLLLHAGLVIGMVFLQRDLGMAIVFTFIFAVMCFTAQISLWYCLVGIVTAVAASPFIWHKLNIFQQKRILVGFHPELDPLHYGWQVIKSKTAIGAGGLFGVGYGKGSIAQSKSFPAKQTDMIFAVICEEAGLIGALCVLALLFILVLKIIHTGTVSRDSKGTYICAGIAGMIMFQVIENVGMCLGLMPVIGITLPFVSYGGSSVLSLYLAMGVIMSIYSHKDIYYSRR